jgi:hypothetical protein
VPEHAARQGPDADRPGPAAGAQPAPDLPRPGGPLPGGESALAGESFLANSTAEIEFLEKQLLAGEFRLTVIRAEDLVLPLCKGLVYAAIPQRDPPFDAFLTRQNRIIDDMPDGSTIGVLNLRSRTQMQVLWPNLVFRLLRGGMQAALEALLRRCELDGLIAPAAAAEHLGLQGIVAEIFNPELVLPSGGQGIMVVLGRAEDAEIRELLAPLHSERRSGRWRPNTPSCSASPATSNCRSACWRAAAATVPDRHRGRRLLERRGRRPAAPRGSGGPGDANWARELAEAILLNDQALIGLLEAEFPEGLPADATRTSPRWIPT